MISCPNCGAENADNANHCGNCGTKLHAGGGAKTMFGFAAVTPEAMKQAAEEARAAENKPQIPAPSIPAPSIPAPSIPAPNIPAPGAGSSEAKTELTPAIEASADPRGDTQSGGSMSTQPTPMVEAPQSSPKPSFATQPESPLVAAHEAHMATSAPGTFRKGEVRDPIKTLLLCLFTCGFGNMYMILKWAEDVNGGLGEEKYNGIKILLIGMLTCGFYAIWQLWNMCNDVAEIQRKWGVEPDKDGTILFILHFVYVGPMFFQTGLNNAWENGRMPA